MKSAIVKSFLIISLFFFGCSKENLVGVKSNNTSRGSVSLNINKTTIPSEVHELIATLSRDNYDTLKTNAYVNNDSLNVLTFENILIGEWHLNVNALNSEGKVIYSGETNVAIIEDETVDVYLTLTSKGSGTGNINIYISWGENSWTDYQNNPIFEKSDSPTNPLGVAYSSVIYDNNKYKMWYSNLYAGAAMDIAYTESVDGISWMNTVSPVLTKGQPGAWDDFKVAIVGVIKDEQEYKLYYIGMQNQYSNWSLGLAVSQDGIHWQKYSSPVLSANENEFQISAHSILKKDGIYYLYYNSYLNLSDASKFYLATSTDGINWERYSGNPILIPSQTWENGSITNPSVIYNGNEFEMVYESAIHTGFGMAVSKDGKNWTKLNSNPFFTANDTQNNWTFKVSYPSFFNFDKEYRIYYTGSDSNSLPVLALLQKYK